MWTRNRLVLFGLIALIGVVNRLDLPDAERKFHIRFR